jgi:hypothetical protein
VTLQTSRLAKLRTVIRKSKCNRTRLPPGLRRRSAVARLLGLRISVPPGRGYLSVVSVVCYQVEFCAAHRSLVQRSCTECMCLCVSFSVTICNNNLLHLQWVEQVRIGRNGRILNATNRLHFTNYARNVSRLYTSQLYTSQLYTSQLYIPHAIY